MDINILDFLTARNIIMAILLLPFLTMLIFSPFLPALSKNAREWLALFGFFGFAANGALAVECCMRGIAAIIYYVIQKPSMFFDTKLSRMVSYYEPFNFTYFVYAAVFVIITILTWTALDKVSPWTSYKRTNPKTLRL